MPQNTLSIVANHVHHLMTMYAHILMAVASRVTHHVTELK